MTPDNTHGPVTMRATPDGVVVHREPEMKEPARQARTWTPLQEAITPARRFGTMRLSPEQIDRAETVRSAFVVLMETIEHCVQGGRERAIVTTHLEEASMWATKAISRETDRVSPQ